MRATLVTVVAAAQSATTGTRRGYTVAMPRSPEDAYLHPYRQAHGLHGSDFKVTLWASEHSQRTRFAVFTDMLDFTDKRVLDAGCSRGDFAAWLLENDQPYAHFIGVDGLCEVIEHAQAQNLPRSVFYCKDFVTHPETLAIGEPDIVAISGSLNTMDYKTALRVLEAAWKAAGETLIFNFLSDRNGPKALKQQYPARRLPTVKLFDWAMNRTWAVRFRQDYFNQGHDATIRMDKRP